MWMNVRAWWYSRARTENIPPDVREYEMRRYLKLVTKQKMTPEQAQKHSTELLAAVLGLESNHVSGKLRDEMIATSMKMLNQVPQFRCTCCNLTYSIPQHTQIDSKLYCDECASRLHNMISSP